MKKGNLVLTRHWGEKHLQMMGIVLRSRRRTDRTTCDVLWANGEVQEFVDPKWLEVVDENK